MSTELQGHGEIVGSPEYWGRLNSTGIIGHMIIDRNKYDYYDSLKNTADEINEVFDEVLDDLRENAGVMRYISKESRDSLIGLINKLNEVCKITNSASERAHYCTSILQISSDLTSYKSYASESEIDNSVNTIERNPFSLSKDSVLELLQKAISNGISSVTWDNEQNEKLLTELSPNGQLPDQNFLKDVYAKSRYFSKPYEYTGSCGRALCSNDYQDYIIQSVFGTSLSRDTKFGTQIIEDLRSIAKNISDDLNYGILHKDYVKDENAGRLKEAAKALMRCDIGCAEINDKVDKLAWFAGGDPGKIERLQRRLNGLEMPGPSGRLLEDGVFGKETAGALKRFYKTFEEAVKTAANSLAEATVQSARSIAKTSTGDAINLANVGKAAANGIVDATVQSVSSMAAASVRQANDTVKIESAALKSFEGEVAYGSGLGGKVKVGPFQISLEGTVDKNTFSYNSNDGFQQRQHSTFEAKVDIVKDKIGIGTDISRGITKDESFNPYPYITDWLFSDESTWEYTLGLYVGDWMGGVSNEKDTDWILSYGLGAYLGFGAEFEFSFNMSKFIELLEE